MKRRGRVHVFKDAAGEWRYTRYAPNGRITDASEEGFKNRWYAVARAKARFPLDRLEVDGRRAGG